MKIPLRKPTRTFPRSFPIATDNYKIPSSTAQYDSQALDAVETVLERGYTAEGPEAERLEDALSDQLHQSHVTVTSSGTAALHLLLEALNIGEGDEVIIPSYTCLAVMNAVRHADAAPALADVDKSKRCLSAQTVEPHLSENAKAIIHVHNFGIPALEAGLYELDVPVIDDISTAIGATTPEGEPVEFPGMATVGSLYATKLISAGYGGFIGTSDSQLHRNLRDLKQYDGREDYRVTYNYSLSDVLAVLGLSQLDSLSENRVKRAEVANVYENRLADVADCELPPTPDKRIFYRYIIQTNMRDKLIKHLQTAGIEAKKPLYKPLHQYLEHSGSNYPGTRFLFDRSVLLPCHPGVSKQDAEYIADSVVAFFRSES